MADCISCESTYKNRLNEKKDETKVVETKPTTTENPIQAGATLNTIKCGKEITSITQVGDTVIVMYADCSYSTVHKDKVNLDALIGDKLTCMAKAVKAIDERLQVVEAKEDKDTIYDDTELRNRIVNLENKPDNDTIYDDTQIKSDIANLNVSINTIRNSIPNISGLATKIEVQNGLNTKVNKEDLIVVENLEGTQQLFKAVKV